MHCSSMLILAFVCSGVVYVLFEHVRCMFTYVFFLSLDALRVFCGNKYFTRKSIQIHLNGHDVSCYTKIKLKQKKTKIYRNCEKIYVFFFFWLMNILLRLYVCDSFMFHLKYQFHLNAWRNRPLQSLGRNGYVVC